MLSAACRIIGACFALLLLPSIAQAQADQSGCLAEKRVDNRISGKVVYATFRYGPGPDQVATGYKLVLLKPRCFDTFSHETNEPVREDAIREVQFMPFWYSYVPGAKNTFFKEADLPAQWRELNRYLKSKAGQLVTVIGEMESNATAHYVAVPQIVVNSLASCEVAPQSKDVQRC